MIWAAVPAPPPIPVAHPRPVIYRPVRPVPPASTTLPKSGAPAGKPTSPPKPEPPAHDLGASAYTGPAYVAGQESRRLCVVRRESGGDYTIVSGNGLYFGAYQFARGTSDNAARRMDRQDLVGTPANRWSKAAQDEAFWVTWERGRGAGHWNYAC